MNKKDLISAIAKESGLTKTDTIKAFDATISSITNAMSNGESVSLIGFGTFKVSNRAARMGRNPQTGKEMSIPAAKVPKFSAGKKLKEAIQ